MEGQWAGEGRINPLLFLPATWRAPVWLFLKGYFNKERKAKSTLSGYVHLELGTRERDSTLSAEPTSALNPNAAALPSPSPIPIFKEESHGNRNQMLFHTLSLSFAAGWKMTQSPQNMQDLQPLPLVSMQYYSISPKNSCSYVKTCKPRSTYTSLSFSGTQICPVFVFRILKLL